MLMTYPEFWKTYLRAHARPATRGLHYAGTCLALAALAAGVVMLDWRLLVAAPVIGYAFAWAAHLGIERNTPKTFGHPLWSLFSDVRMLGLAVRGRLAPHLGAAGAHRDERDGD
jgi:hypothetical protein